MVLACRLGVRAVRAAALPVLPDSFRTDLGGETPLRLARPDQMEVPAVEKGAVAVRVPICTRSG